MAVSQFLRPGGLLDTVKGLLTPDVVRSASSLVGESEPSTRQTLTGAVPSVLSGLTNIASTKDGASSLAVLIRDGGYSSVVDNVRSLFSGGSATNSMLNAGPQLLGTIFGGRSSTIADALGKSSGVSSASSTKLLSLAAPLVLGVLGKRAAAQNLNASALASSLLNEKSEIAAALPSGLSQLFGAAGPTVVPPRPEAEKTSEPVHLERVHAEPPVAAEERKPMRWLPIALAALAALALLMFLRGRTARNAVENVTTTATGALSRITLPGGASLSVPEGSINYNLARFLADTSATDVPKTFVFDHLNFESGSARLTPDSVATVNDLGQVLKAYPNAQVQLSGHTDNTGSAEANQALSRDRANAVMGMLVTQGVATDRITTAGYGQDRPVVSNNTEEGRARNRRLELTVTRK